MKFSLTTTEEFDLDKKQIQLIERLAEGPEYLFDDDMDLADKTPGIYDMGEGKYALNYKGLVIWRKINENT